MAQQARPEAAAAPASFPAVPVDRAGPQATRTAGPGQGATMSDQEAPTAQERRRDLRQARTLLAEHQPRGALQLVDRIVALWPDHEPAWRLKAAAHGVLSEWWSAEEAARRCVGLAPDSARSHLNLGIALRKQGRMAEAQASLRRALSLEPTYQKAQTELAKVLEGPPAEMDWAVTSASATRIDLSETALAEGLAPPAEPSPPPAEEAAAEEPPPEPPQPEQPTEAPAAEVEPQPTPADVPSAGVGPRAEGARRAGSSALLLGLLICIALAVGAAAFLVSSLRVAAQGRMRGQCVERLRSMGRAFQAYANDCEGYWPLEGYRDVQDNHITPFHVLLGMGFALTDLRCPLEAPDAVVWGSPPMALTTGYDLNRQSAAGRSGYLFGDPPTHRSAILYPSWTCAMWDSAGRARGWEVDLRHRGAANLLYADGHVRSVGPGFDPDGAPWRAPYGPGRFYGLPRELQP